MQRYGFNPHFIGLISKCLTSTHIAIRYNRCRTPYFKLSRGFQQGDPLSLLLFLICKGLSLLIDSFTLNNQWKPVLINNQPLNINHMNLC